MHTPANQISMALHSYYTGSSIKTIQDRLVQQFGNKPSTATIFEWINKYTDEAIKAIKDYHPQVGDTWIADETFVRVDKSKANVENPYSKSRKAKWVIFWDIIDADTRYLLATHLTTTRGTQDAKALMEKAARCAGKVPKVVVSDSLKAYLDGVELAFGSDTTHKQGKPFQVENNTNLIERFHGTLKSRTKVMRALKNKDTLEKFSNGWLVHYNYLREHMSLEKPPAREAKVDYPFDNWVDIIRIAHPQVKVLVTPAKVSILKTPRASRITQPTPRITPKMGRLG
jgi:transposase-like protein